MSDESFEPATGWVIVHPDGRLEVDYFHHNAFLVDGRVVVPEEWRETYRPRCRMVRGTLSAVADAKAEADAEAKETGSRESVLWAMLSQESDKRARLQMDLSARLDAESARRGILERQNEELRGALRIAVHSLANGSACGDGASHEFHLSLADEVAAQVRQWRERYLIPSLQLPAQLRVDQATRLRDMEQAAVDTERKRCRELVEDVIGTLTEPGLRLWQSIAFGLPSAGAARKGENEK